MLLNVESMQPATPGAMSLDGSVSPQLWKHMATGGRRLMIRVYCPDLLLCLPSARPFIKHIKLADSL